MTERSAPLEITCQEVRQRLTQGEDLLLVDCRGADEHAIVALESAVLLPLHELPERVAELEPHRRRPIVVYCHLGGRSARAADWLREQGFDARSLEGGIDQWAEEIDPSLPRY